MSIEKINSLTEGDFTALIGPIFEHSPWIAAAAWRHRPFASSEDLLGVLCDMVEAAGAGPLLALIRAHPDLVGRLARTGELTPESAAEQRGAGLLDADRQTLQKFEAFNAAYRARFGFPFIVCARLNSRETILAAFEARLRNSPDEELAAAWGEIKKIAALRLADIVTQD